MSACNDDQKASKAQVKKEVRTMVDVTRAVALKARQVEMVMALQATDEARKGTVLRIEQDYVRARKKARVVWFEYLRKLR